MFKKYGINLLAATIPNIIAPEIVSIQPMLNRIGEIRVLNLNYGSDKGQVKKGQTALGTLQGGTTDYNYSSSTVEGEVASSGKATALDHTLAWLPVVKGSVKVLDGVNLIAYDDGNGKIKKADDNSDIGTINYETGKITATLAAAPANDAEFAYEYNNIDIPVVAPEVNAEIKVLPIQARSRKLKVSYSFDAGIDMMNDTGLNIDNEYLAYISTLVRHEIDGEIMADLMRSSMNPGLVWNATAPAGVAMRDHNESLFVTINKASNTIFQKTRYGSGNFVVAGTQVCAILETLDKFNPDGAAVSPVGPHFVGTIAGMRVYKNPFYAENDFVVGWKGQGLFDAGMVYAPYLPIEDSDSEYSESLVA